MDGWCAAVRRQFTVYARETDKGSKMYVLETHQHVTFWPQQTGKRRFMIASIGNLPGQTKPFDFASSHCTFLRIDNQVSSDVSLTHLSLIHI